MKGVNYKLDDENIALWARATALVAALVDPAEQPSIQTITGPGRPELLRCHEVTRAVGAVLGLPVQDGWCGQVDHSWLWIDHGYPGLLLDVYAVGRLPMVQLVRLEPQTCHYRAGGMGSPSLYCCSPERTDIRKDIVVDLTQRLKQIDGDGMLSEPLRNATEDLIKRIYS